jgi:hypothetical protein
MANDIQLKRSSTPGAVPDDGELKDGEAALNLPDGKLFYGYLGVTHEFTGSGVPTNVINSPALVTVNGHEDPSESTINFDPVTRTYSIAPVGASFSVWVEGVKHTISEQKSIVWSDTTGIHAIYFNNQGELVDTTTIDFDVLLEQNAITAMCYWNSTTGTMLVSSDERHGVVMDPVTHHYNHATVGTRYAQGLAVESVLPDESGDLDAHVQFSVTAGEIWDEDIRLLLSPKGVTDGIKVLYRDGPTDWSMVTNHPYMSINNPTTGLGTGTLALFNDENSGNWTLTEVNNGDCVCMHLFATSDLDSPLVLIVGQTGYTNSGAAKYGAPRELFSLKTNGLPLPEFKSIATFIIKTASNYSNLPQAALLSTEDGDPFLDWRSYNTGMSA